MENNKTIKQQYQDAEKSFKQAQLFILAYTEGLVTETNLDREDVLMIAIRLYVKEQHGFVEPYAIDLLKYKRLLEKKYPELDNKGVKIGSVRFIKDGETIEERIY